MSLFTENVIVSDDYNEEASAVFLKGDCLETLNQLPENSVKLIVTSPPYNLNKEYETKAALEDYLNALEPIIDKLYSVLSEDGSICWQVGNYVEDGEVFPLDMYFYPLFKKKGMQLRNRIIWHFDHGLHAKKRFSGRYETLLWFTKSKEYTFNLDPVRVPSKYPGKRNYKPGPNYGKPSGNPLGKNPSDIWKIMIEEWEVGMWDIPNVKANHPEKTTHPCQFPIELVERCILALTNENDIVLDPFSGVGSAMLAALKRNRRAIGCEMQEDYIAAAKERVKLFTEGNLPYRPLGKPVHKPSGKEKVSQRPQEWSDDSKLI
ncbi:site-specific DNA-methyltransferase [Paracoccaceae bacterium]|nr:site-specific DNA-methyltransferase [Paracoccaceae bacterium]